MNVADANTIVGMLLYAASPEDGVGRAPAVLCVAANEYALPAWHCHALALLLTVVTPRSGRNHSARLGTCGGKKDENFLKTWRLLPRKRRDEAAQSTPLRPNGFAHAGGGTSAEARTSAAKSTA